MMAASVTGLMMAATVSSMAVLAGLCAACDTTGVVSMAAHVRASRNAAGIVSMAAHVCASRNTAGVVSMAAHICASRNAAGIVSMATHICASRNTAGVVSMAAHICASRDTAGVVSMAAHICAPCNTAGVVSMATHVRAPCNAAGVVSMAAHVRTSRDTAGVVSMAAHVGTSCNTTGIVSMAAHVRASRNTAGIVSMAAHICAPRQTAGMIPMAIVSGVRIAVFPIVHVNFCLGTSRNAASAVAVFACHGTAVDAAGPVCMNGLQAAPRQTAVMIPMAIVSGVRIAVHPVVHVNFCLGTSRNAAFFVAVRACHGTAVDAAGPMCMNGFQAAPRQTAVMVPMAVVSGVRIAVRPIVHVRCRFGTSCNVASAVAVLAYERTAVDAAEAMHVRFCLCTSGNRAGKACLFLLCLVRDFHGTSVHRIGDNAACYHGNRYKRNG